jgi:hypothetical protein
VGIFPPLHVSWAAGVPRPFLSGGAVRARRFYRRAVEAGRARGGVGQKAHTRTPLPSLRACP